MALFCAPNNICNNKGRIGNDDKEKNRRRGLVKQRKKYQTKEAKKGKVYTFSLK
jgi:hypothetical protein